MTAHHSNRHLVKAKDQTLHRAIIANVEALDLAQSTLLCAKAAISTEQQKRYLKSFLNDVKAITADLESELAR